MTKSSSSRRASFFSLLSFLAASKLVQAGTQDHFIITHIPSIVNARLDPIVNPGSVSGHVHNIMGASCMSQSLNSPEQQQACDCSSSIIGDDRSNYWVPALYYQYPNGTFSPILNSNRIYYYTKAQNVQPFPPNLRMLSGLATSRNASDPRSLGLRISCDHEAEGQFLPNGTSHPNGCSTISMGIFFPSCGLADGQLDSDDHFSHMAWPQVHPGGGMPPFDDPNAVLCPDTHPIKYPTIFLEANYYLSGDQTWHSGNPIALSTGDQSGLAFHADFISGWNTQTLSDALSQCGLGKGPGEQLQECAPFVKSLNETATWYCRFQNQIPNEDVGYYRAIDELPGCNKIWPSDAPDDKPDCAEVNAPSFVFPNVEFVNLKYHETLPMVFALAQNASDLKDNYIPALGASYLQPWGVDASNAVNLNSSAVEELLAASRGLENETISALPSMTTPAANTTADVTGGQGVSRKLRRHLGRRSRRTAFVHQA